MAADTLRRGGHLRLEVRGESMLPALWPGDVVEIAGCSLRETRRGDIVLACREGRFFLHRLLTRFEADTFLARGDSMPGPDPCYHSGALLGKLIRVVRAGRTVSVPISFRPWFRALGMLFCYCDWTRHLALKLNRPRNARGRECGVMPESAQV
jgi:hypothetical protein